MKNQALTQAFVAILILGTLHYIGSIFYFYWSVVWFDSVMHFVGGFSIGLSFLYFYQKIFGFNGEKASKKKTILYVFIFVMIIGIGWEKFEYVFDIAQAVGESYLTDTTLDLLADGAGAILAGFIGLSQRRYE